MLFRYSCGCVAFNSEELEYPWCLRACDLTCCDFTELALHPRKDLDGKLYTPLKTEEVVDYLLRISKLIQDGYRFRQIKNLLDMDVCLEDGCDNSIT